MLVEQAQRLLAELEDIQRRMTEPENDFEAYNDYYQDKIADLIMMAQRRVERRKRVPSTPHPQERTH
jgi:hypothetical protein